MDKFRRFMFPKIKKSAQKVGIAVHKHCFFCLLASLLLPQLGAQPLPTGTDSTLRCYRIVEVNIVGNKRTKTRIIQQEMRLSVDSTYCNKDWGELLKLEQQWIYGTGLFDTVKVSLEPILSVPEEAKLIVSLKERWYFYPAPVFRLSQYSFLYWWRQLRRDFRYVSYGAGLAHLNFRGLNDRLFVLAQIGNERAFRLNYIWPYSRLASGALIGWRASFAFSQARSLVYETFSHRAVDLTTEEGFLQTEGGTTLGLNYRPQRQIEHKLELGFWHQGISDALHGRNMFFLQSSAQGASLQRRSLGLEYTLAIDLREQRRYPLEGSYLKIEAQRYGLGVFSEIDLNRLRIFYGKYLSLGKKWYLSNLVRGTVSLPLDQAYRDYEALNTGTEMRGYQNYLIQGPLLLHANTLLKREVFHWAYRAKREKQGLMRYFSYIPFTFYGYLYANVGYVRSYPRQQGAEWLNDTLLLGVGPGIELLTFYDLVFGFYYAFTRHENQAGFSVRIGGGN